jgi:hypothetical protein
LGVRTSNRLGCQPGVDIVGDMPKRQ